MKPHRAGSEQARMNWTELLDRAHRGESTIITKRGKPYAAVVPIGDIEQAHRAPRIASLRGTGSGLYGADPRATLRRLRGEWE